MRKAFFEITNEAQKQITNIFDFVWPTAAALWNLRWQIRGFLDTVPGSSVSDLESRFVLGSEIHGTNFKKIFVLRWTLLLGQQGG